MIKRFDITALVEQHFSDDSRSGTQSPELIVLIGGPAVGKTTVRKKQFSRGYVVVDAAEIFVMLDGWENQDFPGELEEPLCLVGKLVAQRAVAERRNIVTELIGADYAPTIALIEAMKNAGYKIMLNAVNCDIEEAERRNFARGNDEISAYFAEPYQRQWLIDAATSAMEGVRPVKDITILIGPPGPAEEKQKFQMWSARSGKSADEIWVEFVHELLGNMARRESPDQPSQFDELFSRVFGKPIRVDAPFMTYMSQGQGKTPGIIIQSAKITSLSEGPSPVDLADAKAREALGSVFGYLLKAEWVRTVVTYE